MPIIGSNLKEMHFKRFDLKSQKVKLGRVKTDIKIRDISERDIKLPEIRKSVIFEFEFSVDYDLEKPAKKKLGEILIVGELVYVDSEDKQKKILADWKKRKKIDSELMRNIISSALDMSQLEAIYTARKVMLPSPVPLPKLKLSDKKQGYIG